MAKKDITPYQLKLEFKHLQLDIIEVMEFTPLDLDLENLCIRQPTIAGCTTKVTGSGGCRL